MIKWEYALFNFITHNKTKKEAPCISHGAFVLNLWLRFLSKRGILCIYFTIATFWRGLYEETGSFNCGFGFIGFISRV